MGLCGALGCSASDGEGRALMRDEHSGGPPFVLLKSTEYTTNQPSREKDHFDKYTYYYVYYRTTFLLMHGYYFTIYMYSPAATVHIIKCLVIPTLYRKLSRHHPA
jgi:hypothetical protein